MTMDLFEDKDFWNWLYSLGQVPLSPKKMHYLKEQFDYKKTVHEAIFQGEKSSFELETISFSFQLSPNYSLVSMLHLSDTGLFEEFLYLKKKEAYFILGWFDCHNHENSFTIDELELISRILKQHHSSKIAQVAFLYLARFVGLTNEEEAQQLMKKAWKAYANLCSIADSNHPKIKKLAPYNKVLFKDDQGKQWIIKRKQIESSLQFLSYTIHETAQWIQHARTGYWTLEGFAAHSIRDQQHPERLNSPINIEDPTVSIDHYNFPFVEWSQLLSILAIT